MGDTEDQVVEYENRLKQFAKRDYFYLFIGLIIVSMAGAFLYNQLNPGRPITLFDRSNVLDEETLQQTGTIAGIIQQRDINFISQAPPVDQSGLSNPNPTTIIQPEVTGQTSSIASGQVTNTNKTYTVEEGDNLEYIAGLMYGDREAWPIIAEANGLIGNPNAIYAGMVLVIPR